jgi:predicted DNA-binding transcriptional regulator YafY
MKQRDMSLRRLVHCRIIWRLDAWCHKRDKLQHFAPDAMGSADVLGLKAVEAEMDGGCGIFAGEVPQWVTLVFSSKAAQLVSREEWPQAQKTSWVNDGTYEMKVPFVIETELLMYVLRHAGQVKVKPPASLVRALDQQLRAALVANTQALAA